MDDMVLVKLLEQEAASWDLRICPGARHPDAVNRNAHAKRRADLLRSAAATITAWNTRAASGGDSASMEQRARERLPALARTHEGQKLYSLAYARGRLKGRQDATVDLGVIGTADQPALGDHQDKALAWDAVCMALNTYAPGWANSEEKTGLQSAVAAIAALANQQGVEFPDVSDAEISAWLDRHDLSHAIRGADARAAFEDAQSFVLTTRPTQPAGDVGRPDA